MAASYRITRVDYRGNEEGLIEQFQPIAERKERSLLRRTANEARARVPVRTGALGRSIREDGAHFVSPFHIAGSVTAGGGAENVRYAAAVHEGARPHVIRARNAKALHFFIGGREIFCTSVNHPGMRARPFLRNAAEFVGADP